MSNATPMSSARRADIYARLSGADNPFGWTPRQRAQWARMDSREHYRAIGTLPISGASGLRTRQPRRRSLP